MGPSPFLFMASRSSRLSPALDRGSSGTFALERHFGPCAHPKATSEPASRQVRNVRAEVHHEVIHFLRPVKNIRKLRKQGSDRDSHHVLFNRHNRSNRFRFSFEVLTIDHQGLRSIAFPSLRIMRCLMVTLGEIRPHPQHRPVSQKDEKAPILRIRQASGRLLWIEFPVGPVLSR